MIHDVNGHHYVERITQIIPDEDKDYRLKNIIIFDKKNKRYRICGRVEGQPAKHLGKEWYELIGNS